MKKTKFIFRSFFVILLMTVNICAALASNGYEKSISIEGTNNVEYNYKEDAEPKTNDNATDSYRNRNITDIYPWNNNLYYPNYYTNYYPNYGYGNYGYGIYYTGRPEVITYSRTGMEIDHRGGRVPPPEKPPKHPPEHHPYNGNGHRPH